MSDKLVVVATSYDILEAEFLRNHLEGEGFKVFLADDGIVGANAFLANAVGGIKLKVPSDEAEDAAAFVEELRNAEIIGQDEFNVDAGWGECEMCESRDVEIEREPFNFNKFLLFMGVPVNKPKRRFKCNNCGNVWIDG
ncbi:MAG: putative signal transducing protein [Pyrinomonadaceae bacterium]